MNRGIVLASLMLAALVAGFASAAAPSGQDATLSGRVIGVEGKGMEGALVFIYAGPDVRRSPEFTAGPTDRDGRYRVVVPPGRYRAVARVKMKESMGPLMPGDKHSGEPREVEIGPGGDVTMDFVVLDLKEALKAKRRDREGPVRISGRILDDKGLPVRGGYVAAHRPGKTGGMPDYLSAWTDGEGRFTLVVPRGLYSLGTATTFPSGDDFVTYGTFTADRDLAGLDIIRKQGRRGNAP